MAWSEEDRDKAVEHICIELEKKRSLTAICAQDEAAPPMRTFLDWIASDARLSQRYARAREAQVTGLLEESLEIAERATDDVKIIYDKKRKKHYAKIDNPTIKRAQLQIETRERFAKMMMPERFNQQRMDLTSKGEALAAPVQINDNRIQALLTLAASRAAQLSQAVDVTPIALSDVMDG